MAQAIMANKAREKWELIETITQTESAVINRTQEPDGTPYNFSKIMVAATGFTGQFKWYVGVNGYDADIYWTTIGGTNLSTAGYGIMQAEMVNGLCIGRAFSDLSATSSNWDYASSLQMLAKGIISDSIVSIKTLGAVSGTIKIYAVRA